MAKGSFIYITELYSSNCLFEAIKAKIKNPGDRKTLFGNVVKKCIQCSRTSEKRNNIVKKFKYSASYFELYTKFTPNEKDFRCGFQISYEP